MSHARSVFLTHALDCIDFIQRELHSVDQQGFQDNRLLRDAVLRNLEIIGQCCKDYGIEHLAATHPDIRWQRIAGIRNQLAHEYLGLDLELVWNILQLQLQPLRQALIEHLESQS